MSSELPEETLALLEADGWEISYDEAFRLVLQLQREDGLYRIAHDGDNHNYLNWFIVRTDGSQFWPVRAGPDFKLYFNSAYAAVCALEYRWRCSDGKLQT